jgi:hypothetical protein
MQWRASVNLPVAPRSAGWPGGLIIRLFSRRRPILHFALAQIVSQG